MFNDYRDAALMSGIELPHWAALNVIQRGIWDRMAEGCERGSES